MSLYDHTSRQGFDYRQRHRCAMGGQPDTRPRCEYCVQLPGWCLCGPAPTGKAADVDQA